MATGIGILYESKEWSSYALLDHIRAMGAPAVLIDLQKDGCEGEILSCDLIVNRIFASAAFRGHQKSLDRMPGILESLRKSGIPVINPGEAHAAEISKAYSANILSGNGLPVPKVYGVFTPAQAVQKYGRLNEGIIKHLQYPCIVKPDCGGRTSFTYIVRNETQLSESMKDAPDITFIAEEYLRPTFGFVTRIEVIDRACRLILKRSVAENGLSAYHLGSSYAPYPDCPDTIKNTTISAMDLLKIEVGSMDIIENENGFFIIDVNAVSNASEDNTEMFSFDLMKETAAYVVGRYNEIT
jgi:ribosomal protein S6--L-glutamate ligase